MHLKWPLFSFKKPSQAELIGIYIADNAGQVMQSVDQALAITAKGLSGDRYCNGTGYWDPVEGCQVTLISQHDLQLASKGSRLMFDKGQHRRNLLITGIKTKALKGKRFQIGEAIFIYEKPRPPCGYLNKIEGRGMAKALSYNSGICIRVIQGGQFRIGEAVVILDE